MRNKKIIAGTITGLLALALGASIVGAAPDRMALTDDTTSQPAWHNRHENGYANLTESQQQEMQPFYNQMFDIRKQMLNKMVALDIITQSNANQQISWMEEVKNDWSYHSGYGMRDMGHGVGYGRAALTKDQKQEIKPFIDQMMDVRKQMIQKLVSDGVITQVMADQRISWMKERTNAWANDDTTRLGKGYRQGQGGRHHN